MMALILLMIRLWRAGNFNNWGEFDMPLIAQEDADWTYEGTAMIINPDEAIREGKFEFKYAIPRGGSETADDEWENFPYNRSVEWDGNDDLQLEDVWFSNERDFTRMQTNVLMADTTIPLVWPGVILMVMV